METRLLIFYCAADKGNASATRAPQVGLPTFRQDEFRRSGFLNFGSGRNRQATKQALETLLKRDFGVTRNSSVGRAADCRSCGYLLVPGSIGGCRTLAACLTRFQSLLYVIGALH